MRSAESKPLILRVSVLQVSDRVVPPTSYFRRVPNELLVFNRGETWPPKIEAEQVIRYVPSRYNLEPD